MKRLPISVFLITVIAFITGCGQSADVESEDVPKYSATQFFTTTSYGLPDPDGYAFSAAGAAHRR